MTTQTFSANGETDPIKALDVVFHVEMTSGNGSVQPMISYDDGTNWLNVGPAITATMSAPKRIHSGVVGQSVKFSVTYSSADIDVTHKGNSKF